MLATTNGAARRAIEQDGKINLARDIDRLRDEHLVDHAPRRTGLMRDQRLAQHLARDLARFGGRFDQMHAALESVRKRPLPSSAGMNLRLDDQIVRTEFARDLLRFRRRVGHLPARRGGAKFFEQFLRLVFVNVHACGALGSRAISVRNAGQQRIFPRPTEGTAVCSERTE